MNTQLQHFFATSQTRVESVLKHTLEQNKVVSKRLSAAIHYVVFNGGKRIRPTLCYASALAFGKATHTVDCAAAAIEFLHCYSLVHDDLPAMDDDDLRRGKPTCHIAFDEATAILAGDALQAFAFQVLAQVNPEIPSEQKMRMLISLAIASGSEGVAAGQALDLAATNTECSLEELETIHHYKTGTMISACIDLTAQALGEENSEKHLALRQYAKALGLAFQVKDDILDIEGNTEKLGKNQGADQALNKNTYPRLLGLDAAKQKAQELHQQSLAALKDFGAEAELLRLLSQFVIDRES